VCVAVGLVLPRWAVVAGSLAGVPGGPPVLGVSLMALLFKDILVKLGEGLKSLLGFWLFVFMLLYRVVCLGVFWFLLFWVGWFCLVLGVNGFLFLWVWFLF